MMHGGTKARESEDKRDTHQLSAVSFVSLKRSCSTEGFRCRTLQTYCSGDKRRLELDKRIPAQYRERYDALRRPLTPVP